MSLHRRFRGSYNQTVPPKPRNYGRYDAQHRADFGSAPLRPHLVYKHDPDGGYNNKPGYGGPRRDDGPPGHEPPHLYEPKGPRDGPYQPHLDEGHTGSDNGGYGDHGGGGYKADEAPADSGGYEAPAGDAGGGDDDHDMPPGQYPEGEEEGEGPYNNAGGDNDQEYSYESEDKGAQQHDDRSSYEPEKEYIPTDDEEQQQHGDGDEYQNDKEHSSEEYAGGDQNRGGEEEYEGKDGKDTEKEYDTPKESEYYYPTRDDSSYYDMMPRRSATVKECVCLPG